jgi:hypothetical protein
MLFRLTVNMVAESQEGILIVITGSHPASYNEIYVRLKSYCSSEKGNTTNKKGKGNERFKEERREPSFSKLFNG